MSNDQPTILRTGATFSRCERYRFDLFRIWDESKPKVMFVGLNPSTADATKNDPTVTRCIRYAQSWGYGGMHMMNIFAFRATDPSDMKAEPEPIGTDTDEWLLKVEQESALTLVAWGNHGAHLNRAAQVCTLLSELHCLKQNKNGYPAHPLYLKASLTPIIYQFTS